MNEVITRVVDGSRRAEEAGVQMEATRQSTAELVRFVQHIAKGSVVQARTSLALRERAESIRRQTEHTSEELRRQSTRTDDLVSHSRNLIEAVSVFQLPGHQEDPRDTIALEPGEEGPFADVTPA